MPTPLVEGCALWLVTRLHPIDALISDDQYKINFTNSSEVLTYVIDGFRHTAAQTEAD
jgi:hypothetical protein